MSNRFGAMAAVAFILLLVAGCSPVPLGILYNYQPDDVTPQFIETDFVDIAAITKISKFRSGAGHNYSDRFETQSSMKHYLYPAPAFENTSGELEVRSPVDGTITMSWPEGTRANQVRVVPSEYPFITIVFFHVEPTLEVGAGVVAGDTIGYADLTTDRPNGSSDFDVAAWTAGGRLVSYFELMTDSFFASRFPTFTPDDFIIPRETRDADPVVEWNTNPDDWVTLP